MSRENRKSRAREIITSPANLAPIPSNNPELTVSRSLRSENFKSDIYNGRGASPLNCLPEMTPTLSHEVKFDGDKWSIIPEIPKSRFFLDIENAMLNAGQFLNVKLQNRKFELTNLYVITDNQQWTLEIFIDGFNIRLFDMSWAYDAGLDHTDQKFGKVVVWDVTQQLYAMAISPAEKGRHNLLIRLHNIGTGQLNVWGMLTWANALDLKNPKIADNLTYEIV